MSAFYVVLTAVLLFAALGGAAFAFSGSSAASKKRMAAAARPTSPGAIQSARTAALQGQQRRKSIQSLLKELEKKQSERKQRPSLKKQIAQAGLRMSPRTFWILSGIVAALTVLICLITRQPSIVALLAPFAVGLGFPRWAIHFLKKRRQKQFTNEFANAIDVIVRSVKSGLPVNEALKIVAREIP